MFGMLSFFGQWNRISLLQSRRYGMGIGVADHSLPFLLGGKGLSQPTDPDELKSI